MYAFSHPEGGGRENSLFTRVIDKHVCFFTSEKERGRGGERDRQRERQRELVSLKRLSTSKAGQRCWQCITIVSLSGAVRDVGPSIALLPSVRRH